MTPTPSQNKQLFDVPPSSISLLSVSSLSALLSSSTSSSTMLLTAAQHLSSKATSSLKDFEMQLGFLGTDVLDEQAFNALLDNIGYRRSREGLWDSFLAEVASITKNYGGEASSFITVADMANVYASETYHLLDNGKNSGDALMDYVDKREKYCSFSGVLFCACEVPAEHLLSFRFILFPVFDKANTNMQGQDDNELDKDEFRSFFRELMGDNYSDEAADEAFDAIDVDGSGGITVSEFKEGVLKSNKNKTSGLPRKYIISSTTP
jgi:hypothetical protein